MDTAAAGCDEMDEEHMLVLSRVSQGVAECVAEFSRRRSDRRTIWGRSESLYQRLYGSRSRELLRSALPLPSAALPGLSGEKNTPTDLLEATGRLLVESSFGWLPATVRGRQLSTGRRVCAAATVRAEGAALTTSRVGAWSDVDVGTSSVAVAGGCSNLLAVPDPHRTQVVPAAFRDVRQKPIEMEQT